MFIVETRKKGKKIYLLNYCLDLNSWKEEIYRVIKAILKVMKVLVRTLNHRDNSTMNWNRTLYVKLPNYPHILSTEKRVCESRLWPIISILTNNYQSIIFTCFCQTMTKKIVSYPEPNAKPSFTTSPDLKPALILG